MLFYHVGGMEEISGSGNSFLNCKEAIVVQNIVASLFSTGVQPENIGVITPYEGQRVSISSRLEEIATEYSQKIEVALVFLSFFVSFLLLQSRSYCTNFNDSTGSQHSCVPRTRERLYYHQLCPLKQDPRHRIRW